MERGKVLIEAFENQRRQNPTLQLNKNRYYFTNINLSNFSQHLSHSQLEEQAKQSSMRRLWAALNAIFRGRLNGFGDIGRHFSKSCTETFKRLYTIQNDEDQVSEKIKSCFFSKYSVSQDNSNA